MGAIVGRHCKCLQHCFLKGYIPRIAIPFIHSFYAPQFSLSFNHMLKVYLLFNPPIYLLGMYKQSKFLFMSFVTTLLWEECESETHTFEMGAWEFVGTPETSEFNFKGQNTLHWGFFYIIGKFSKCTCQKWARMSHLDICSTSYGKKKGWESNWQFDSQPPKVINRPNPDVCRWSATCCWKNLDESYKFALDLISIGGLSKKLWPHKVAGVETGTVLGLLLGSPRIKNHLDVGDAERHKEYYMGEGGGFPRVQAVMSLVSSESPVACPSTEGAPESELTNLLVGWMQIRMSNQKLVTLPSPISELQHAPSTPF